MAPAFAASSDFAIDKPTASPAPNLGDDFACQIHDRLRPSGFRGCVVFECHGAGQRIAQQTFDGVSWREAPESAAVMFAAFATMRPLHELLVYLHEAAGWPQAAHSTINFQVTSARWTRFCSLPAEELASVDVDAYRARPPRSCARQASCPHRHGRPTRRRPLPRA